MSDYTPTIGELRTEYASWPKTQAGRDAKAAEFDRALAAHDAEARAGVESDPAKDERLVRYMSMVTPLGYQSALTVVQQMTLMIQAETEARRAGAVAEEPEWEYAYEADGYWEGDEFVATMYWHTGADPANSLARRRKAGPWVPVKQEGADRE